MEQKSSATRDVYVFLPQHSEPECLKHADQRKLQRATRKRRKTPQSRRMLDMEASMSVPCYFTSPAGWTDHKAELSDAAGH
ncbi:hypothetical protein BaRGS_00022589 [Batillaria attramentaria]|uniref:Uncharacterized protein n=1 Tax=Batillaria attramentaria TaxID=370345 RepID=A0ABD0KGF7_9CAEN